MKIEKTGTSVPPSIGTEEADLLKSVKPEASSDHAIAQNPQIDKANHDLGQEKKGEMSLTGQLNAAKLQEQLAKPFVLDNAQSKEQDLTHHVSSQDLEPPMSIGSPSEPTISQKKVGMGDKGPEVLFIQKKINEMRAKEGLPAIKEDGKFGPQTQGALKEFQKNMGLKEDGVAGSNSWDRLMLDTNRNFEGLDPQVKQMAGDIMNGNVKNPEGRTNIMLLTSSPEFAMLPVDEQRRFLSELAKDPSNPLLAERLMVQVKERAAHEVDPDRTPLGKMPVMGTPDKNPEYDL